MDLVIPSLPHSLLLLDSINSDNAPLIRKRTRHGLAVVSSFSSHNQKNNNRVVVEEVDSRLRSEVVALVGEDKDRQNQT